MDQQNYDQISVKALTVKQLKRQLKSRKLSVKGKKDELCERLLSSMGKTATDPKDVKQSKETGTETPLKITDFNSYVNEYEEFKAYIINRINGLYESFRAQKSSTNETGALLEAIKKKMIR